MANLRVGVLGAGRIGKIHIENLARRIQGVELVAVADALPEELEALKAKYGIADAYSDWRNVVEHPGVDAVVICLPTDAHYSAIMAAAAAGKHIFCEKPVDLCLAKIDEISAEVRKAGIQTMVGFNRRFDPTFLKVRDMVASGKVGKPHVVKITSRDPAPPPENYLRASGGIFMDMTIHDFDMARYLSGSEVVEVYARATVLVDPVFEKVGDWDTAIVSLTFENGALGTIDNSRKAVYGYDQRIEVFGSEGMVTVKNNTPDNHVFLDRVGTHASLPLNFFMERYTESYLNEMQAFVDSLRKGQTVPVNEADGRMAVAIALAAAKSATEHRPVKMSEIR